jgi:CheY-like chemotaxis protein
MVPKAVRSAREIMARITVVDDDRSYLEIISEALVPEGHEVVTCADPDAALTVIRETSPDLVMLDVRMGTPDRGWALLEALQADPANAGVRVVVVTADTRQLHGRETWLQERGVRTLEKPFDLTVLFSLVDEALCR